MQSAQPAPSPEDIRTTIAPFVALEGPMLPMLHALQDAFGHVPETAVPVLADTGVMGGNESHEFMVLAPSGEDKIVMCPSCGYASNMELAVRKLKANTPPAPDAPVLLPAHVDAWSQTSQRPSPDPARTALASWIWSRFGMACLRYE